LEGLHARQPGAKFFTCFWFFAMFEIEVGDRLIGTDLIGTWKAHTDFSVLETLNFESHIAQDTLDRLAASSSHPSLK
jgi:hypothetical protein